MEATAVVFYVITSNSPPAHLTWPARPAIDEMRPLVAAFEDGSLLGLDMDPCSEGAAGSILPCPHSPSLVHAFQVLILFYIMFICLPFLNKHGDRGIVHATGL